MVREIKGYTTLELLFVVAIISLLSALFIREFLIYTARERLKSSAEELAGILNYAKTRSMITMDNYGFCFNNNTKEIVVFIDKNKNQKLDFPEDLIVRAFKKTGIIIDANNNYCYDNYNDAIFDRRGELFSSGANAVTINLQNTFNVTVSLIINPLGRISISYGN